MESAVSLLSMSRQVLDCKMEVVQETSPYVNTTSPDKEYEEIQLDERKPRIKDPDESELGSQIELTSRNRNSSKLYRIDESTGKEEMNGSVETVTAYSAPFTPKRVVLIAVATSFVSLLALVISLLAIIIVITASPKTVQHSQEPTRMTMPSFQEMKANFTAFEKMLAKSEEEMRNQWNQYISSKKELTNRLEYLKSVNKNISTLCESSKQKMSEFEGKLKGMNFSGSGTNTVKINATKLWTEVHNAKNRLEIQTGQLQKTVEKSQANFTELHQRFTQFSKKLNVTAKKMEGSENMFLKALASVNDTLTTELKAILNKPSSRGPPGYNGSKGLNGSRGPTGPPGPKGAGNFTSCQYKFKESSSGVASRKDAKNDAIAVEPEGKRIVGATCSTDDAKEYRLSSERVKSGPNTGKRSYKCKCAGKSDIMTDGGGKMKCFLHYWECPKP